jgi:hypothetical protein
LRCWMRAMFLDILWATRENTCGVPFHIFSLSARKYG